MPSSTQHHESGRSEKHCAKGEAFHEINGYTRMMRWSISEWDRGAESSVWQQHFGRSATAGTQKRILCSQRFCMFTILSCASKADLQILDCNLECKSSRRTFLSINNSNFLLVSCVACKEYYSSRCMYTP